MNRKDREIHELDEIVAVLAKCDTVSLGLRGADWPYVVPVSFGVIRRGGAVALYFHGALRGLKVEMLKADPRVCVEGHIFHKAEETEHGITTRYESVIGFGTAERVEGEEAIAGLSSITAHYSFAEYPVERCASLPATAVYRVRFDTLTGKRNLGE